MKRREFLKSSLMAGGVAAAMQSAGGLQAQDKGRDVYEVRIYDLPNGTRRARINDYLSKAAIPAWNRIGVKSVGVFTPMFGGGNNQLYVLLPHPSPEAFFGAEAKLAADDEYQKAGAEYLGSTFLDPAFLRYQSMLLLAFKNIPRLRIPPQAAEKKPRIFELRCYESHSEKAALKKIEMFNEGGEISIFDSVGLRLVFCGQTLIGQKQPNLMYMSMHDDLAARDKTWAAFSSDPGWKKLSADPAFADTVSVNTIVFLRPTAYSQI
jgi:hypothetical protein